jgi:hypothetical protein
VTVNDPWVVLGLDPGSSIADARAARRRLAKELHPDLHGGGRDAEMSLVNQALAQIEATWEPPAAVAPSPGADVDNDESFSIECLPAEAFEALFLAAYGLGDILVADEPYLLELYLWEPAPCFCRLSLVPEAGGSLVTVDISPAADGLKVPEQGAVIDVLIAELKALVSG